MIDPLALWRSYLRAGNWLLPWLRQQPELRRLPARIGSCSVHFDLGGGRRRAYLGIPTRPTLKRRALELALRMHPLAATWMDGYGGDVQSYLDGFAYEYSASDTNASATYIILSNMTGDRSRGLLKFDVSGVSGTINSATLYVCAYGTRYEDCTNYVRRILSANSGWVEGASWNYANPSTVRWAGDTGSNGGTDAGCSVSGTDYSATALGSWSSQAADAVGTEYAVTLGTTEFGEIVSANYGIVMWATPSFSYNYICSSDHATTGYRPKLVVDYTVAGGTTNYLILSGTDQALLLSLN